MLNLIYKNPDYFIILQRSSANKMNFCPVEEQNLTYVALKCKTQIFVKNKEEKGMYLQNSSISFLQK